MAKSVALYVRFSFDFNFMIVAYSPQWFELVWLFMESDMFPGMVDPGDKFLLCTLECSLGPGRT